MKQFIPAEHVELFHLHFLEQFGLKTDKRLYALKGGCNLRFFLKSIRYSQDIDLDIKIVQKEILANCPHCNQIVFRMADVELKTRDPNTIAFSGLCPHCIKPIKVKIGVKIIINK